MSHLTTGILFLYGTAMVSCITQRDSFFKKDLALSNLMFSPEVTQFDTTTRSVIQCLNLCAASATCQGAVFYNKTCYGTNQSAPFFSYVPLPGAMFYSRPPAHETMTPTPPSTSLATNITTTMTDTATTTTYTVSSATTTAASTTSATTTVTMNPAPTITADPTTETTTLTDTSPTTPVSTTTTPTLTATPSTFTTSKATSPTATITTATTTPDTSTTTTTTSSTSLTTTTTTTATTAVNLFSTATTSATTPAATTSTSEPSTITTAAVCSSATELVAGLPPALMTSSSAHTTYLASEAILDNPSYYWKPKVNDGSPWIQVDFQNITTITTIVTQGGLNNEWVETYTVEVSDDYSAFTYVTSGGNQTFAGNFDMHTHVSRELDNPVQARYVRITPLTSNFGVVNLRLGILGCYSI